MHSPFPGMDPYLERPDLWGGIHARLIAVLGEMLARQVAPRFFVDSEDSVYVLGLDDPARPLGRPDLCLAEAAGASGAGRLSQSRGQIAAPTVLDVPASLEIRAPHLNVVDTADRQVVTTIELLSPFNKVANSSGRRDFLRRREHILNSHTHWLEIDLLRAGTRPPGIPERGDYDAALHRAGSLDRLEAWFVALREPLPTVAVPLRSPFADVPLDLQEAVETVYDRYRYETAIDYAGAPSPPSLSEADASWTDERIAVWRQASGN